MENATAFVREVQAFNALLKKERASLGLLQRATTDVWLDMPTASLACSARSARAA